MTNALTTQPGAQVPTDPAQMEDYFRQYAQAYAEAEPSTGQSISVNNGVMTVGDQAIPGNQFAAIILDAVHINAFYGAPYNPQVILPPTCYAIGRTEMEMAPHPDMNKDLSFFQPQAERCAACPQNVFGSAAQGSGKACKNKRRMLLVVAGTYTPQGQLQPITDISYYETTPLLTLNVAPTSAKNWGRFVRETAGSYNRPPFGMIARVYLYPHEKHGKEAIGFDTLAPVPDEWVATIVKRQQEAQNQIGEGYEAPSQEARGGQQPMQQRGGGFR